MHLGRRWSIFASLNFPWLEPYCTYSLGLGFFHLHCVCEIHPPAAWWVGIFLHIYKSFQVFFLFLFFICSICAAKPSCFLGRNIENVGSGLGFGEYKMKLRFREATESVSARARIRIFIRLTPRLTAPSQGDEAASQRPRMSRRTWDQYRVGLRQ